MCSAATTYCGRQRSGEKFQKTVDTNGGLPTSSSGSSTFKNSHESLFIPLLLRFQLTQRSTAKLGLNPSGKHSLMNLSGVEVSHVFYSGQLHKKS